MFKRMLVAISLLLFSATVWAGAVNINTGDVDTLSQLYGVGPSKAQAIVDYRTEKGLFESKDQLVKVNGIGTKTLERNRANIDLGGTQ